MARADILLKLVRSGIAGDRDLFRRAVEVLIAEERAKQHNVLADRLEQTLRDVPSQPTLMQHAPNRPQSNLVHEITPRCSLEHLILPDNVLQGCQELVEEQQRMDLLRSYALEPRHSVLLVGPPGTGKTSLAEAVARALMYPLFVVRYEGVVGSYLGETTERLHKLFEFARSHFCVLFFDEFDTLGKERGDEHEVGEIKRVVSSFLLQMDELPSHVVIMGATNHPELLDRAAWRRFELCLYLPLPDEAGVARWLQLFEEQSGVSLPVPAKDLTGKMRRLSFADLASVGSDILRRRALDGSEFDMARCLSARLAQLDNRHTYTVDTHA